VAALNRKAREAQGVSEVTEGYIDPDVLKRSGEATTSITQKTVELRNEIDSLASPVKRSELAMEMWIAKATEGTHPTEELEASVAKLRETFQELETVRMAKFKIEAVDKATLARLSDDVKTAMQQIREAYESGEIDLEASFEQRRAVIEKAAQKELAVLRDRLGRAGTEPERITLQTEIDIKEAESVRTIVDLQREKREAIKDVTLALQEQQAAEVYQRA
jgi:hypothetical protein